MGQKQTKWIDAAKVQKIATTVGWISAVCLFIMVFVFAPLQSDSFRANFSAIEEWSEVINVVGGIIMATGVVCIVTYEALVRLIKNAEVL